MEKEIFEKLIKSLDYNHVTAIKYAISQGTGMIVWFSGVLWAMYKFGILKRIAVKWLGIDIVQELIAGQKELIAQMRENSMDIATLIMYDDRRDISDRFDAYKRHKGLRRTGEGEKEDIYFEKVLRPQYEKQITGRV